MIVGKSYASAPPNIRRPIGLHNGFLRHFLLILPRDIFYMIAIRFKGEKVKRWIRALEIEEVITAARSPLQNAYVERINICRAHLSLNKNPPEFRGVESVASENIVGLPRVGGLHHRYTRIAA
jgi:hypothetical protein